MGLVGFPLNAMFVRISSFWGWRALSHKRLELAPAPQHLVQHDRGAARHVERVLDAEDGDLQHGVKNSLNVACCASIVLYEVLRRWGKYESVAAIRLSG